jgi:hypothetical protein
MDTKWAFIAVLGVRTCQVLTVIGASSYPMNEAIAPEAVLAFNYPDWAILSPPD